METKHTPGPWSIFGPNALSCYTIHTNEKPNGHNQICQTERIEDARLIAAAPELMDALQLWIKCFDQLNAHLNPEDRISESDRMRASRSAIAKATQPKE